MTFPNLRQNGEVQAFPKWAQYLVKLGIFMSKGEKSCIDKLPSIAIVSLPRIDYASIFAAYGALVAISINEEIGSSPEYNDLDSLIGKTVSYLKIRGSEQTVLVGILKCINHDEGRATLLTKINTNSNHQYNINRTDWNLIRGTDIFFDIAVAIA